jgi:hypothetical protein
MLPVTSGRGVNGVQTPAENDQQQPDPDSGYVKKRFHASSFWL